MSGPGSTQTQRNDWPWPFFRRLDAAVGEMIAENPTLDAGGALRAVLSDDPDLAAQYRLAMRWLGSGPSYAEKQERVGIFSEAVAEMRPALRTYFQRM